MGPPPKHQAAASIFAEKASLVDEFKSLTRYFHQLEAKVYNLQIEHDALTDKTINRSTPIGYHADESVYKKLRQPKAEIEKNNEWLRDHIDELNRKILELDSQLPRLRRKKREEDEDEARKRSSKAANERGGLANDGGCEAVSQQPSIAATRSEEEETIGAEGKADQEEAATGTEVVSEEDLISFG